MSEWIPFLQSLVWPIFIAILLLVYRKHVRAILKSITERIERGEFFQVGSFILGSPDRKFKRVKEVKEAVERVEGPPTQYENVVYMVHQVARPRIDDDGVERRSVQVILDADDDRFLDLVERVVYHLHPTFSEPDKESKDREHRFELRVRAWGQFNLTADIYFKGHKEPLTLRRYLNF